MTTTRGTMTRQWTVWCYRCGNWDTVTGTKKQAEEAFIFSNWGRRGSKGKQVWYCVDCIDKLDKEKENGNGR
jgi:hypothetical protein